MQSNFSIVIPARDEAPGIGPVLERIRSVCPGCELIVVDDGSADMTGEIAGRYADRVVTHPYSMGNGAAVKSGARIASKPYIVFMDADGQHDADDIPRLAARLEQGYSMVVGARNAESQANRYRRVANLLFNRFASLLSGVGISDLTSGFRAVEAGKFKSLLYLLPNGFSYPTTITMAFLRCGFPIAFEPVAVRRRSGKSKISPLKDGTRFLLIILKIGSLFSPLRVFVPISLLVFLAGSGYYLYTFITMGRLTNMSAILFISSLLIFLIGVVSEQISALHYQGMNAHHTDRESAPGEHD